MRVKSSSRSSSGWERTELPLWRPHPGPQTLLFSCPADIILYGGAKGGGKTEALLMWCAQDWHVPGYRALILRRTFPQLERHLIPRSQELLAPLVERGLARYDARNHRWTFQTRGGGLSVLEFGFLERDSDVNNFQGAQYARIAFDESTQFTEYQVRTMLTCLRSPAPGVRRQVLLVSNPTGPGYGWHKAVFVDNREEGRIYRDAKWPSDGQPVMFSTCFIPACVFDNPTLLERDPLYPERLRTQAGPIARAMLLGDWSSAPHLAFDFDYEDHTCDPIEIPPEAPRWIGIDWGAGSNAAACVWLADWGGRVWVYDELAVRGELIVPFAERILERSTGQRINYAVLSHECFNERGMGITQADQFREVLDRAGIVLLKSSKDAEGRLQLVREYLRRVPVPSEAPQAFQPDWAYWERRFEREGRAAYEEFVRLRSRAAGSTLPKLRIFRTCSGLIRQLPALAVDVDRPTRLADGQEDDLYDALGYALQMHWQKGPIVSPEEVYTAIVGPVPESGLQAALAWQTARTIASLDPTKPRQWGKEPWRSQSR